MMKLHRLDPIHVYHIKSKNKQWPKPISITVLVDIFTYGNNTKMADRIDYEESITHFCDDKNNYCRFNSMTHNVEFNNEYEIKKIIEYVMQTVDHDVFEWIAVHTHSFQSVKAIKKYTGNFFDDDSKVKKYSHLFDTRHVTVHTFSNKTLDPDWFDLVCNLFKVVEKNNA